MDIPLRGTPEARPIRGRRLLHRALVVAHFSPVMRIADESGAGIADFQEAVRDVYPNIELEYEQVIQFEVGPEGITPKHQRLPVWRLTDVENAWRVSLTRQSIALEVPGPSYTNWQNFADRIHDLVEKVGVHFTPAQVHRIGVRYINAAATANGSDPREECAPALVSISGNADLEHADLLWRFRADEGELILRSGLLLPKMTYDPSAIEPVEQSVWYLDIDVVKTAVETFEVAAICSSILALVKRAHEVYRWAFSTAEERA